MNLDIRLHQGPALSQQLNLAPQLLNWLRLLQCPTTELSNLVARELDNNPALETDELPPDPEPAGPDGDTIDEAAGRGADPIAETAATDADVDAKIEFLAEIENEWRYDRQHGNALAAPSQQDLSEKHQFMMDSLIATNSLQEHLLKQACSLSLDDEAFVIAQFIIGSVDDRGYLTLSLDELARNLDVAPDRVAAVLAQVQSLDPAGVGARDLAECLSLQLNPARRDHALAAAIVSDYIEELAARDYPRIAAALGVSEEDVEAAAGVVATLDPHPGMAFNRKPIEYVTPDVTVSRVDGELVVELNDEQIPHLRVSAYCRKLLAQKQVAPKDRSYIREKMRAASFLIQGIGQRQETLRKVTLEILRVQRDFFEREEGQLRPLTMAKVAAVLGVHETTVSRALANKFIQTPRGVFEMKHFFRSGYLCSDGTSLTPEAVKAQIKGLVDNEDPAHPLTDLDVVEHLERKGLHLARRTIAKYRDEMGIAASKQRKRPTERKARLVRIAEPVPRRRRAPRPARRVSEANAPLLALTG